MPDTKLSLDEKLDTYIPIDLSLVPAVDSLLESLGLGSFVPGTVQTRPGRNPVWIGETGSGTRVFVKSLSGDIHDVKRRIKQTLAFEASSVADDVPHPYMLGADENNGVLAYAYLHGETGVELMVEETFGLDDAKAVGAIVASLHAETVTDSEPAEHPAGRFLGLAEALPLSSFEQFTAAQMHAWRLMQQDGALLSALQQHLDSPPPAVTAIHGDLRVDQLLRAEGQWFLTDWEEFGAGDPAHDVGSFIGEWINRSVLDVTTTRGDASSIDFSTITHEQMMQRTAEKILRLQPTIQAFWEGYTSKGGRSDPGFLERIVVECGWHLIDRMLASAAEAQRLGAIQRAAAGLGRRMILQPGSLAEAIGLHRGDSQ